MNICENLAKYFLIILNTILLVCSILLMVYGGYVLATEDQGLPRFTDFSLGGLAVAVGVIVFFITIFGCFGAIKESNLLLNIYSVILIIVLILQIVLAVYSLIYRDTSDQVIKRVVEKVFEDEVGRNNGETTGLIDKIQQKFECCGVENSEFWVPSVPPSCCANNDCAKQSNLFGRGCVAAFKKALSKNMVVIGGVAIAFAIVELLGIVAAYVIKRYANSKSYLGY